MNVLYGDETIELPKNIVEILKENIPTITDDKFNYLFSKVNFIVMLQDLKFLFEGYNKEDVDDMNYIVTRYFDLNKRVDEKTYTKLKDYLCLVRCRNGSIFNPNMKDIFAQMPYDVIEMVDAFEILEYPQTMDDLMRYEEVMNKSYCLTRIRTYKRKGK